MKKIYYLGIALAACLSSCSDDSLDNGKTVVNPVQTGDEIIFGSKLSGDAADSRTVYGDRTETGVPVYWKEKGDSIAIFCPQSSQPASHLVNYKVLPELDENGKPTATASTVTKFDSEKAGLQWGSSNVHEFYAFYPARAVKETIDAGEAGQGQGKVRANIPVEQDVTSWRDGTMTIDGKEVKTHFGLPNMDLAYMYAYNSVDKNTVSETTPVNLQFHNLLTVLDITIPGPEKEDSVVVTAINVDDVSGENLALTGDFYCYMTNKSGHEPGYCEPVSDPTKVNNRIAISTYNPATKKFITLKKGEQINVKAYIIPHTGIGTRKLQVSVVPLNGVAKRKLLQTADIVPSKINRVRLPYLEPGTETNYWMSNIDPNVYFTELSIPGSHQSVGVDPERHNVFLTYDQYQNKNLQEQFNDGIRAFHFQTTYNRNIRVFACGRTYDELYTYLKQLDDILSNMPTDKKDFVVVNIGFKSNGNADDENEWYNELASELKNNRNYTNLLSIYKDGIDANTTIGQLARKIVLRIDRQGTTEVPALISAQPSTVEAPAEKDMYWGSTNNGRVLTMYAQDATSIDNGLNERGELPNMTTKLDYMKTIFSESVNKYKSNDAHDYLYYMNVGGFYCNSISIDSEGGNVIEYTEEITPNIIDYIQMRGQDAALGLVMMNFADKQADSGAQYGCDALIQTIINNNFTFALRKKSSTTTTNYNATYNRGGNAIGWDE
ncbi:MAG: hypothetical protein H9949_06035 [Candidatus Phocaeicola merdigallinarum]|nr:hypothetical protein [Candidatus Phocaeicola merdigallinarum]